MPDLADPLVLPSGLRLPNRLVKAAMTENLADARNQPTTARERLYRRWAAGGSGLLVAGNLMVDRRFLERSRNIVADAHLDVARLAAVRRAATEEVGRLAREQGMTTLRDDGWLKVLEGRTSIEEVLRVVG